MTDYDTLAQRLLGCEARERRMHPWCETHEEPWPCPVADEAADEVREAWRAETDALLERLAVAERRAESLAALLADVAASAWDEGYRLDWTGGVRHDNPYRTERTSECAHHRSDP